MDCAGAYGLHVSPSLGALRVIKKSKKKTPPISEPFFLAKTTEIFKKKAPKGLQKGDGISGQTLLGPPLEPPADF